MNKPQITNSKEVFSKEQVFYTFINMKPPSNRKSKHFFTHA